MTHDQPTPAEPSNDQPVRPAAAGEPHTVAEPQETVGSVFSKLGPASLLAALALALPPLGGFAILVYMDSIAQWLEGHRGAGPLIFAAAFALFAGMALLPTYAQSILGGWAFGIALGFPAALFGFVGGSFIGYSVARPTASGRVESLIRTHKKWQAVRDALVGGGFWRTLGIVTLLRLPPNSPFALTNLVMASVRVPLPIYLLGTAIGMAPRTFAAVWLGSALHHQFTSIREGLSAPKPWWLLALGILLTLVMLGIVGAIANKALQRVAGGPGPANAA